METNTARPLTFQELLSPTPRTVLLAEDDDSLRERMADDLRADGFTVVEISDGLELLDQVLAAPYPGLGTLPDVIIAELCLPGCSGLEACQRLRAMGATVPFILIAPTPLIDIYDDAERVGAAYVFDKPLDLDGLRNAVSSLAGGW